MKQLAKAFSLGLEIACCIVLPVLIGHWLDEQFSLLPFGVMGGALIGAAAAFYKLVEITKKL